MYLTIIAVILAIAVMAGCNTMAGGGKDVRSKDVQSIDTSLSGPSGQDSAPKDGLPCGPRRLQSALPDFSKSALRRACV